MEKLWRLMLAGRVQRHADFNVGGWRGQVKEHGLTLPARLELREVLKPRIRFRKSFRVPEGPRPSDEPTAIEDLVDWDIVLGADHAGYLLKNLHRSLPVGETLAPLLPDVTALLRDALDLMRELEGATDEEDPSTFWHPSIGEHRQNEHYRDWTFLIDLARDAWVATAETDPLRARLEIQNWLAVPYPLFKRLAFFAARDDRVAAPEQALEWLLLDEGRWLWSRETQREAIRLIVAIAPKLTGGGLVALEEAILRGSRRFYPLELAAEDVDPVISRSVWLRLKIQAAGVELGTEATEKLEELLRSYPDLTLAEDERDEFAYPRSDGSDFFGALQEDHWQTRCKTDFPAAVADLCQLASNGGWPSKQWRQALQTWCAELLAVKAFLSLGKLVSSAPDDTLKQLAHPVSGWLEAVAKEVGDNREPFFTLAERTIALHRDDELDAVNDPVSAANSHPIGNVVQALLAWWHSQGLKDDQGLGDPIRPIFEGLCDPAVPSFRHGRVILAQRAILLFRVDRAWTEQQMLPLFDWSQSADEARAAWCGFLWTPRVHAPLLAALKPQLLATANHYGGIGGFGENYAALLTLAALDPSDWITRKEIAPAIRALPEDGLVESLRFATRALQGAGEQSNEYWEHRIKPFLQEGLPKSKGVFTRAVCAEVVRLCVASGNCFPDAVDTVVHWLQPQLEPSHFVLDSLIEAQLCERFPAEVLSLLHAVVDPQRGNCVGPNYLKACLDAIVEADQRLAQDDRMQDDRMKYLRSLG